MSQDKLQSLQMYAQSLKTKLEDKNVPEKHKGRILEYREFLVRELEKTTRKIEELVLAGPGAKK